MNLIMQSRFANRVPVDFKEDYFQCWPVRITPARSKSRLSRLFRGKVKPARIRKKI